MLYETCPVCSSGLVEEWKIRQSHKSAWVTMKLRYECGYRVSLDLSSGAESVQTKCPEAHDIAIRLLERRKQHEPDSGTR